MTNEYELADDSRDDLIFDKGRLLAPLIDGMEAPPHPMRLADAKDYYRGTLLDPAAQGDKAAQDIDLAAMLATQTDRQGS